MDFTHLTPTTIPAVKPPPESESETPPSKNPTPNGVLKRHAPPSPVAVKYKECLKNHAATMGGHALDGCGEFMPAGDPTSLTCAACGCHRNFHRRDPEFDSHPHFPLVSPILEYHPHHRHHPPPPPSTAARGSQSPPPISSAYPHMLLGLSLREPTLRKRFRTKFNQEQKDKMLEFAEKIGWKMRKINEEMVRRFCSEVGVERGVFKVWMHNNKNASAKRAAGSVGICDRNGIRNGNEGNSHSSSVEQQDQDEDDNRNQSHSHNRHECNGRSNGSNAYSSSY